MKSYVGKVLNKGASVLVELRAWHGGTWKCSGSPAHMEIL